MPLFMVKRKYYDLISSGEKDVELRAVKPQWKNSKPGDTAVVMNLKPLGETVIFSFFPQL